MESNKLINVEIDDFYSKASEESRLEIGLGPLELERNKDLIQRFLPTQKGVIVDVGGGPGVYSEWLAQKGHNVHLVDPVAKHIKQANKRSGKLKKPFNCVLGEARNLAFPDNFADLIILHGPLYHLQVKQDRIDSINEAKRVLKPNGILLGFAINYTASTLVGLLQGAIHDPQFLKMCKEELTSGLHNPPKNAHGMLARAYYHKPPELRNEFEETGLEYINTFAVEGLIWLDGKYFETRLNAQRKEAIMDLLKTIENDPNILSLSPHMMIAAKKK